MSPRREYFAINALRIFAATWVVIYHADSHFGSLVQLAPIQYFIGQGKLAMGLFFMLSGFILSYRYKEFTNQDDVRKYTAARLARLYPVYIFMGAITFWVMTGDAANSGLAIAMGLKGTILHGAICVLLFILAIHAWFPALFGIWNFGGSWSLSVEAFFYALFPWLRNTIAPLNVNKLCVLFLGLVSIQIILGLGKLAATGSQLAVGVTYYILPIFRLPEFVLGITGYVLFVEKGFFRKPLYIISFSVFLLFTIATITPAGRKAAILGWEWLFNFLYMGVFVSCLQLSTHQKVEAVINYLGRISYCVYISQFFTIPVIETYAGNISIGQSWALLFSATFLAAVFTYHLIEKRAYNPMKKLCLSIMGAAPRHTSNTL